MVRRNAKTDEWHEATDNALGTDTYGTAKNDPIGATTFSIAYKEFKWTKIMFAFGSLDKWIVLERTNFETVVEAGCSGECGGAITVVKASDTGG